MGIFDKLRGDSIRVRVEIHGTVGGATHAIDDHLRVPVGTTLAKLVDVAQFGTVKLEELIAAHPALGAALTINGAPCPYAGHGERVLADGDQLRFSGT